MGLFFSKKLNSDQLQEKIGAFDQETTELETRRDQFREQHADLLAKQAVGEDARELPGISKQIARILSDLEGRDAARFRLTEEVAAVECREQLAAFGRERKEAECWLSNRVEAGKQLAAAIRTLGQAILAAQADNIPPSAVLSGLRFGYGGASADREILLDAAKFEPLLFNLAESVKVIGGIEGGDSLGRKYVMINPKLLSEAATSAKQTSDRLREMAEASMARHEAKLKA